MLPSLIPFFMFFLDVTAFQLRAKGQPSLRKRVGQNSVAVFDTNNTAYAVNITLGGEKFNVLIDTGSADLWVNKPVPNAQYLGFEAGVTYADNSGVFGFVELAEMEFSGFTIKNQAFIQAPTNSSGAQGYDGLLGLSPYTDSQIIQNATSSTLKAAGTFFDNVFRQNTSSPNFMTIELSRNEDNGIEVDGIFSIATVSPRYEKINSQPKLPIVVAPDASDQHWATLVDGIIGPDGKHIPLPQSVVNGTPADTLVAVYDTGFTLPQLPTVIIDAIYSDIPGARYDLDQTGWVLPCKEEVNLTFIVGGQNYPVHPFDTVMNIPDLGLGPGLCLGAFQNNTPGIPGLDMILGMAFDRNVYMLLNYGDFVLGNPNHQGAPFMQLLSTTNPAKAHHDFVQSRLGGVDTTGSQNHSNPSVQVNNNDSQNSSSNSKTFIQKNGKYFAIGGGILAAIILLGACVVASVWRSRRRGRKSPYATMAFPGASSSGTGTYKPLLNPGGDVGKEGAYSDQTAEVIKPFHASGYGDGGHGYVNPYA
ncbi:hypothetical protein M422DRAFT_28375 [Sphaerobolus stellatus SS14]|nr:hypothetical protein M422DRAFT_28375 [Sphaerobolus stellatus SS14]